MKKKSKPQFEELAYLDAFEVIDYINHKYKLSIDLNALLDDNVKNDAYCTTATWCMKDGLKAILETEFGTCKLLLWVCW